MTKLSITIIGHNEVQHLKELLPTLHWADEVIYVDCESADNSIELAKEAGCRIFSRPNNPNLNLNKSYAMEQVSGGWIFYLDPDERISEELATEIQRQIQSDSPHSAFQLNRRNHYFGQWLRHGSQYPDKQLRFFRTGKAQFPNQQVHEKLQVAGSIGSLENDLLHYPYLDINQFFKKFSFYTGVEADYLQKSNTSLNLQNHLRYFLFRPWTRFFRRYFLKGGFRDGIPGLFCALFDALNIMVRYFKLWERQNNGQ